MREPYAQTRRRTHGRGHGDSVRGSLEARIPKGCKFASAFRATPEHPRFEFGDSLSEGQMRRAISEWSTPAALRGTQHRCFRWVKCVWARPGS